MYYENRNIHQPDQHKSLFMTAVFVCMKQCELDTVWLPLLKTPDGQLQLLLAVSIFQCVQCQHKLHEPLQYNGNLPSWVGNFSTNRSGAKHSLAFTETLQDSHLNLECPNFRRVKWTSQDDAPECGNLVFLWNQKNFPLLQSTKMVFTQWIT